MLYERSNTVRVCRVVYEAEASGGGSKAGGLPHSSLSLFPPLPFPFPLSFQTNQWEGRSDPVRGKFPGFPPYKYHPVCLCMYLFSLRATIFNKIIAIVTVSQ